MRGFVDNIGGRTSRLRHLEILDGWFGMGSEHVMVGDVFVVILGVNVPMVMRRKGMRGC